jgi:nicotinate-nucleotide pyrophosphorylase (carboxylating)
MNLPWNDPSAQEEVVHLVDLAIEEDVGKGDITSESLFDREDRSQGTVVTREEGVVAGLPVFHLVYQRLPGLVECESRVDEGAHVKAGTELVRLEGQSIALMKGERTALNFLQRMSGIATRTSRLVDRLEGSGIKLLDTRKTTPGHRLLEKYAVRVGGGSNHRMDLSSMILVKENHIAVAGGVARALETLTGRFAGEKEIEVEVRNLEELDEVMNFRIDRVMLDNFSTEDVRSAVSRIDSVTPGGRRPKVEVSGGIGEHNIDEYRIEGVDYVSIGSLTHSITALDISMVVGRESFG